MTDPSPQPAAAAPFSAAEDKQYATLATFLNIILLIPALIFFFAFKDRGPLIKEASKENLNWTINVTALYIIFQILFIATALFGVGFIFSVLGFLLLIVNLIFSILGGVKVNSGAGAYRYPVNIRWIK
jgi:uncharacterized Tic20 family protein